MKRIIYTLPIWLLIISFGYAFNNLRTISGKVTDNDGNPLIGVTVKAITTGASAVTDVKGHYSIKVPDEEVRLVFSYIGFKSKEVKTGRSNRLDVTMMPSDVSLSEVVTVGYGTEKRSATSSARSLMSSEVKSMSISGAKRESKASSGTPLKPVNEEPQARQLTAGEWNDLNNWDFWRDLMNSQDWSKMQSHWGFFTDDKISVRLVNKEKKALPGYEVAVKSGSEDMWKSVTNYNGTAELWPSLCMCANQSLRLEIRDSEGRMVESRELKPKQRQQQITVVLNQQPQIINKLDILFMVDATGSMGDEINYLKSELQDIISRVNTGNTLTTRLGMVFYRDRGDEYIVRDFDFDADISKVQENLSAQSANGGGDFEEAVDEALESAVFQQRWTEGLAAKIMFMILDAPPHHDPQKLKSIQRAVRAASEKGIALIPVVASGINKETEFLMRFMAMRTNGTYVFLTDHSGIGNPHLKPTVGLYNVEYLNTLMLRLIRKYAGLGETSEKEMLTLFAK